MCKLSHIHIFDRIPLFNLVSASRTVPQKWKIQTYQIMVQPLQHKPSGSVTNRHLQDFMLYIPSGPIPKPSTICHVSIDSLSFVSFQSTARITRLTVQRNTQCDGYS